MNRKPNLRVVLVGRFDASVSSRVVEFSAWRLTKAKDLIEVLTLSPGRRLPRDRLLEILWPGRDAASALNSFHQVVHAARRGIGSAGGDGYACLILQDETLQLCPDGGIEVDADEFESAAQPLGRTQELPVGRTATSAGHPACISPQSETWWNPTGRQPPEWPP